MTALNKQGPSFLGENTKYYNLMDFKNTYLFCNSAKEYDDNINRYKEKIKKLFEERAHIREINFHVKMMLLNKNLRDRNVKLQSQDTNFNFRS